MFWMFELKSILMSKITPLFLKSKTFYYDRRPKFQQKLNIYKSGDVK